MNTDALTSVGLSEKGAAVYLAALALGTTSVQEIARKTKLKRPTVYLHIDELMRNALLERVAINNKQYYRAAAPEMLEARMKKNLATLQSVLPELAEMSANVLGRPQVRVLEGEEGIKRIYEEMQDANSLRFWSDFGKTYNMFADTYAQLADVIREKQIGVRDILADSKESRRYAKPWGKMCGPTYAARLATTEGLANDTAIYGNVAAMFRLNEQNLFVVRIEDRTIADSMRALFDMAWKSAKPFK